MDELCDDLAAEHADLDRIASAGRDDGLLDIPTPAIGWTVRDQISHLWYFDRKAMLALVDPDAFAADATTLLARGTDASLDLGRQSSPSELLDGWRRDREALVADARMLDPRTRVPWYGPAMGARSFITARLMETWAHGQDVVDALGADRQPTDRLRHVAHIGVGARPFSYVTNGRSMPHAEIRVELRSPSGDVWTWGPADADDRVGGSALDFCLLVTQRRHRDDLDLTVTGGAAADWLEIAQAFAGPPGEGRHPGSAITGR